MMSFEYAARDQIRVNLLNGYYQDRVYQHHKQRLLYTLELMLAIL